MCVYVCVCLCVCVCVRACTCMHRKCLCSWQMGENKCVLVYVTISAVQVLQFLCSNNLRCVIPLHVCMIQLFFFFFFFFLKNCVDYCLLFCLVRWFFVWLFFLCFLCTLKVMNSISVTLLCFIFVSLDWSAYLWWNNLIFGGNIHI